MHVNILTTCSTKLVLTNATPSPKPYASTKVSSKGSIEFHDAGWGPRSRLQPATIHYHNSPFYSIPKIAVSLIPTMRESQSSSVRPWHFQPISHSCSLETSRKSQKALCSYHIFCVAFHEGSLGQWFSKVPKDIPDFNFVSRPIDFNGLFAQVLESQTCAEVTSDSEMNMLYFWSHTSSVLCNSLKTTFLQLCGICLKHKLRWYRNIS